MEITLKRMVEGEFAPQYWSMTGGEFDTMLDAVKALSYREWTGPEKVWRVKFDGIKALREAGYTVEREPDVRVELHIGQQSIEKLECGANAEIVLNYRRPDGEWAVVSSRIPKYCKIIHFDFEPAQIAEIAAEVRADEATQRNISEKYLDSFCRASAIIKLTSRAIAQLDERADTCYKEHRGKRTLAEHKSAVQKVWEALV